MRSILAAILATAALSVTPAFAAQSPNSPSPATQTKQTTQANNSGQSDQNGANAKSGQNDPQMQAMSQSKLRDSLSKAGFSDVQIVDAAYVVRAQSPNGEEVVLFINPPASKITASDSGSNAMTNGSGSNGGSGNNTKSSTAQ